MTLSYKILAKAAGVDKVFAKDKIKLRVNHCVINDGVSHKAVDLLIDENNLNNKDIITVILDHDIPAGSFDSAFIQKKLIDFSKEHDLNFIQSTGIGYEIMLNGVKNGEIVVGCGGHNGIYGVNNALGIKLSVEETAVLLMDGYLSYSVPECVNVEIAGRLPDGASARDFMLQLISEAGDAFCGYIVEITGDAIKSLKEDDKKVVCSLMSRTSAASVLMTDGAEGKYAKAFKYNLNDTKQVVTMPGDLNTYKTVEELKGTKISAGFIGACTGGHIDDLRLAAEILKGKRIKLGFRLLIGCVSNEVFLQAMDEGLIDIFFDFGAQFTNPGCASCRTTSIGVVGDGESLISTGSYNYAGCAGTMNSKIYLASVETVAKTAISGVIGE
ncbi:MAG TPA: 3-isopropylmalate dehydratase [Clostridiales bacterium]|nr:3-isopropylmalate dehydratase [Clostridiales bacterium]